MIVVGPCLTRLGAASFWGSLIGWSFSIPSKDCNDSRYTVLIIASAMISKGLQDRGVRYWKSLTSLIVMNKLSVSQVAPKQYCVKKVTESASVFLMGSVL